MKKILFMPLACISMLATAQTITVRDNSTREPVENVIIKDKNNKTVSTDNKGKADLAELDKSDSLWVWHTSFNMKKIMPSDNMEIGINSKAIILDEIVYSANRTKESKIDVPYKIEVIKQKDIEFGNQPNTGDVLANTGNIVLQKSQLGGGSPNIRGFEASRVLIVVDGIRMNNAIYRAGHLQDVMTLDAQMLDRAEVIFGPSSTMYGSDALGGVMHFYTKKAQFSTDDKMLVKANAMMRYGSANNEMTGHVDVNLGFKKFASMTNITYSNFGDLTSGSVKLNGYTNKWDKTYYVIKRGEAIPEDQRVNGGQTTASRDTMAVNPNSNKMLGSGYHQTDILQRFSIKTGEHLKHDLNFQLSLNPDLPRYDRLGGDFSGANLKYAENAYSQNRLLAAYTLEHDAKTAVSDNIKFILGYQKIDQDRITRNYRKNNRTTQMEDVGIISANLDIMKTVKEKHEIRYGIEFTSNDVKSTAKNYDIVKDSTYRADTRYAPTSKMTTFAAYFSHAYEVNDNFVISDGLRYTYANVVCNFTDTLPFKFPDPVAKQKSQAVTGSLGFTWKAENDYKVSFLANTGFRTPNVDDMSKLFASGGSILVVANPSIKPEYAYNLELGISKIMNGRFKFDVTGFYTIVENYLTQRDFKLNGQDSITYDGNKYKIQAMQNTDRAYIYGFNAGCQFDFNEHVSFKSTLNYTFGRYTDVVKDSVVALDHIPPVFGQSSLFYKGKNTDIEFFARYSGKKILSEYSPSGEDNLAYATPSGMPGWFTLNIRAAYNITKNLRINVACENITDNRYRTFASGVNSPGRNFIVSLRFKM
jgi:hemoglobin/transferrin/lactoferrin receptor protein